MNKPTMILMLVGFALRLFLIFPGPLESKVGFLSNPADLRNYYWPAQIALHGENPYVLWSSGQSGEYRSDMAPFELLVYVGTVAVWNDPRAIQILFAVFDVINIVLLGLVLKSSPLRLPFQVFYALGPLTVYNLVLVPQDKTIALTCTFLIFFFLSQRQDTNWEIGGLRLTPGVLAVAAAALLAAFKWMSVFYIFPLLLFVSRDVRGFIKHGVLFGAILGLAHLPWIPTWAYVYAFRSGRINSPMHIAPASLLKMVGLFDKTWLLAAVVALLLLIYWLFWLKRIDILETLALATAAGVLWTPDMDPVHLSMVVIYFLLVVNWTSRGRQALVWGLGFWVAAVYAISTHTGFARYGLPDLRLITGEYGSMQMILLSYVLFAVVLGWYVFDKWGGRAVGQAVIAPGSSQGPMSWPVVTNERLGVAE